MIIETNSREALFVAKAVYKPQGKANVVNSAIKRILATQTHLIATDGKRLHGAPNTSEIEPGTYTIIKQTKTCLFLDKHEDDIFPNWQQIAKQEGFEPSDKDIYMNFICNGSLSKLVVAINKATGLIIDHRFLLDVEGLYARVKNASYGKPLCFGDLDGFFAIITPLNDEQKRGIEK